MIAATAFLAGLVAYAWAGWRLAVRLMPARADVGVPVLLLAAYIMAAGLLVVVTAGLGGFRIVPLRMLSPGPFAATTVIALTLVHLGTRTGAPSDRAHGPLTRLSGGVAMVVAITAGVVSLDLALAFGSAPANWDAMTYHLFFPARWLQDATILHVPTVFGDNAAAYAPQNGATLFAWSMLLLGSDAATNVLQLLGCGIIAVSVYNLARWMDASPTSATLAAALVFFLGPLRRAAMSADVDAWMTSFFIAGLVLLIHSARTRTVTPLLVAGLAAGLVAGTKTLGSTLALLLFGVALVVVLRQRRPAALVGFVGLAIAGGGFWYIANLILYGNPLFPLDFGIGPLRFAGAYDVAAVRAGEFHLGAPGAVVRHAVRSFGVPTAAILVMGAAGLAISAARRASHAHQRTLGALLLLVSVLWSLWFVVGIPHNTQTRFLLPAAIVLLPGLALAFDGVLARHRALGCAVALSSFGALSWDARPIAGWAEQIRVLAAAEVSWPWLVLVAAALVATSIWWRLLRGRVAERRRARLLAVAAFGWGVLLIALATEASEESRMERFARSDFAHWVEGLEPLHRPNASGLTVAYSGANVPYILTGRNFRHRVHYVNTGGAQRDGFHDYWERDGRRRYAHHKPGIYRRDDDPSAWQANLDRIEPTLFVVFALHPFEREYLPHTPQGYPMESDWAAASPNRFEPMERGESTIVFRIRPAPAAANPAREVAEWFAGQPVCGVLDGTVYPPAPHAILGASRSPGPDPGGLRVVPAEGADG